MARDPLWDTEKLCSHAPRVGAGEPGAAATTRRVEGAPATASADGDGPDLPGSSREVVDELAGFGARGTARDRGRLAPAWIQMLLGVEESAPTRSAQAWDRAPLLKLGLTVSQAPVSKYMVRPRRPPSQAWRTFLKNHAPDLIALDFFAVPTATFRVLFVLVILTHSRRRLVHLNVTEHPTAEWTARQLLEACALEEGPRYLIRDRPSLWRAIFASGQDIGHPGDGHRAPLAVARRVCRAGDWLEVRQLLQRDADTFIAV